MRFIGDIHGKTERYVEIANESPDSSSIQVGDFGMGFDINYDILEKLWGDHFFIRGNHDNPQKCAEYELNKKLVWIRDGNVWHFRNKTFLFIGGAFSIDYVNRTEGVSWWRDEELTIAELNTMIDHVKGLNTSIDYVITHDCPESACPKIEKSYVNYPEWNSRTRHALQAILEINKPKNWIHGHWHIAKKYKIGKTRFFSLAECGFVDLAI